MNGIAEAQNRIMNCLKLDVTVERNMMLV